MKKSLLAVAVAAALPAVAHAQSSVTLFGIMDASVEYSNANANASTPPVATGATALPFQEGKAGLRLNSGTQSGSRFGVRGSEDLGGGLKAIFTLEHGFDLSTGDTGGGSPFLLAGQTATTTDNKFWNRQIFVGLEGRWGALTMGRQYSPLFWALLPADFSGYTLYNNWAASTGSNTGAAGTAIVQGPFRLDNSLSFKSPTMGGLTVYGVYAFGENLTNNPVGSTIPGSAQAGTGDIWGLAAGWQLGGLYLTAGYHSIDRKTVAGATATAAPLVGIVLQDVTALAASYRWTNFGLSLGYTSLNYEQRTAAALATPSIKNTLISGFANLGPGQLLLNVVRADFTDVIGAANTAKIQFGLGYTVPLSKRTNWYVAYGKNDYSGAQSPTAAVKVDSQQRFSVGIRHLF
ncbi:MAG: porin [Burkholderiales bacterium]